MYGDLEPLAFRIRPRREECFDSWIDRLVTKHETTRRALYEHLEIDPSLAGIDLASTSRILPDRLDHLVERLAWATLMPESAVRRTFVACPRMNILPPGLRTFGCAECWLDWHREGVPLRISRQWIFKVSTWCSKHKLLLTNLRRIKAMSKQQTIDSALLTMVEQTRVEMSAFSLSSERLALTGRLVRARITGQAIDLYAAEKPFVAALASNRFHFTTVRHLLLASLHSRDHHESERLEEIFQFNARPLGAKKPRSASAPRPQLPILVSSICRVGIRRTRHMRTALDALSKRLELAKLNYVRTRRRYVAESVHTPLLDDMRARLAPDIASRSAASALRGLQDALFYLKDCGWQDDNLPSQQSAFDPWDEIIDDERDLRRSLARRFDAPRLQRIIGINPSRFLASDEQENEGMSKIEIARAEADRRDLPKG